jgi:Ser/Thr protein kinase RdoA (MazF antagonist)
MHQAQRIDRLTLALEAAYALTPPVTAFRLEHAGVNNANLGVRTGAGDLVVRAYDSLSYADLASIEYEHALLAWTAGRDLSFAVPAPLPSRAGRRQYQDVSGRWYSLAPKLPGTPLALQPYDAEVFGAAVGELQAALQRYPSEPRPPHALFSELFGFGSPSLNALTLTTEQLGLPSDGAVDAVVGWWRAEAARLKAFVEGAYRALPWQLCHNDLTPNNVLSEAGVVTGVLDFEFAVPTARAMDFATSLRMVMRFWEPTVPSVEIDRFCRGYARWIRLNDQEIAALPELLRLRSAITVLWWIGRAAATGEPGPIPARIESAQKMDRWLARHESVLMDVLWQALR